MEDTTDRRLVHWAPRRIAGAVHDFPEEAMRTRVISAITCPACLAAIASGAVRQRRAPQVSALR